MFELYDGKLSCTVLRGVGSGDGTRLPDKINWWHDCFLAVSKNKGGGYKSIFSNIGGNP